MSLAHFTGRVIVAVAFVALCAQQAVVATPVQQPARPSAAKLQAFDRFVAHALVEWGVPGMAIGLVDGSGVLQAKGYGVRTVGRDEPVDAHTVFAIASATKTFTSMLAAMSVDARKVRWDDAVAKHLPELQFSDSYLTREVTLRDLLAHRTGLPRADYLWYANGYDSADLLRRIRFLKPAAGLRSRFTYSNLGYLAAGEALASANGQAWSGLLRERVFVPLGMSETTTSLPPSGRGGNIATPHGGPLGAPARPVPWVDASTIAPAGSVSSTLADMLTWIRFQLAGGVVDGKALVTPPALRETRTPQQLVPFGGQAAALTPFTRFLSYGMGWYISDHRGHVLYSHGGNVDGMQAQLAFSPDRGIGVVVLANRGSSALPVVAMYKAIDLLLGAPPHDWEGTYLKATRAQVAAMKQADEKRRASRDGGTKPSLPLASYAGGYGDEAYGDVHVSSDAGRLIIRFGRAYEGELEHWQDDVFRVTWGTQGVSQFVTFMVEEGKATALTLEGVGIVRRTSVK